MSKKQFWVDTLGKGWAMELKDTLKSPYMDKLMEFISTQYAMGKVIPNRDFLFRAFRLCPWESLRVVILGREPREDSKPNGLAYGDHSSSIFSNSPAVQIWRTLEYQYYKDGFYLDFDFGLKHWAEQGVLLLDRSLTNNLNSKKSHRKPWGKFISAVINSINESSPATIFVLWGKEAQALKPYIKSHNYILEYDSPYDYIWSGERWDCPNFKEIDEILFNLNGSKIKW